MIRQTLVKHHRFLLGLFFAIFSGAIVIIGIGVIEEHNEIPPELFIVDLSEFPGEIMPKDSIDPGTFYLDASKRKLSDWKEHAFMSFAYLEGIEGPGLYLQIYEKDLVRGPYYRKLDKIVPKWTLPEKVKLPAFFVYRIGSVTQNGKILTIHPAYSLALAIVCFSIFFGLPSLVTLYIAFLFVVADIRKNH